MPDPRDFLPAMPPYPPIPKGLIDYLSKTIVTEKYYAPGDVIYHWKFGNGRITSYKYDSGRWLVDIEFFDPQYGIKTFFAEVPYLSKEEIPKLKLK